MKMPFDLNKHYTLPKHRAEVWAVGSLIYWDGINKLCTVDPGEIRTTGYGNKQTSNKLIGSAAAIADNPSESGEVRLNGTDFD